MMKKMLHLHKPLTIRIYLSHKTQAGFIMSNI